MDSIRDYSSIIHSPSFTFLVGPRHTKLTIQSGLAQHVSKPLHNLMNNGHTRESKHRIAVLEDEDVETFVAFCEYAYTGDYIVPRPPVPREEERARTGVVENAPSPETSWRQTYRSESMSSAVPPPAPSPPESVGSATQTVKPQSEQEPEANTTPVIEEQVPAEAKAETEQEDEPKQETSASEQTMSPDEPEDSAIPLPEEAATADVNPEAANEQDEWGSWAASTSKKSKKSKKKKQQKQQQPLTEEPPASLTPPSTPPPEASADPDDTPSDNTPEEPIGEQEVGQGEAPTEEQEPTYDEPTAEPEAEPASGEWETSPTHAPEDGASPPQQEGPWVENEGEDPAIVNEPNEPSQSPPKPFIDMSFAKQSDSSPRTPGLSLWDEFTALQYNDERPATSIPPVAEISHSDLPYLTFHAKVYVFATRYLIPALAQLCLRKLHSDLLYLSFAETDDPELSIPDLRNLSGLAARQAPMVLDLLRYAYTKTTRLEPISPTSATQLRENELRRLVVHYAACKVKELARYHSPGDSGTATPSVRRMDIRMERAEEAPPKSLRALLDMTPELASDLVYRMM